MSEMTLVISTAYIKYNDIDVQKKLTMILSEYYFLNIKKLALISEHQYHYI